MRYALIALLAACMAAGCSLEGDINAIKEELAIKTVTFTDLASDGSETETTARLTLTFDSDVAGLTAADITLDAGTTGAAISTFSKTGTGKYELTLSGVKASGEVRVTAAREGYIINGNPRTVQIFYYHPEPGIPVTFNSLTADGSETVTTTKLILVFDKDIGGLSAGDITLDAGETGAVKGALTRTGTGLYELAVTGITASGEVSVTVAKGGYDISGNPQTAEVVYYSPPLFEDVQVSFNSVTADGSLTATTAKLTLAFDKDIADLTVADIALIPNSTGTSKGALTRTGTGAYELAVTDITASGEINVSVSKTGYTFGPANRAVNVFAAGTAVLTITFNQIADNAPFITGPVLYRHSNSGPTSEMLTVDDHEQYESITWRVQDTNITGTGPSFTLSAANAAYNLLGEHFVTVSVMKDGVPFNKTVSFWVEY